MESEVIWTALIAGGATIAAALIGAFGVTINLLFSRSKDTITAIERERDYWRTEALDCRTRESSRRSQEGPG